MQSLPFAVLCAEGPEVVSSHISRYTFKLVTTSEAAKLCRSKSPYSKMCLIRGGKTTDWIKWDINLPAGGNRGNCVSWQIKQACVLLEVGGGNLQNLTGPQLPFSVPYANVLWGRIVQAKITSARHITFSWPAVLRFLRETPLRVWCF